jgi:fatty-acyl-CoA synthase
MTGLLDWLDSPDSVRGVRFANDDGGWDFIGFDELASGAHAAAAQLQARDLRRGGVVSIIVPTGPAFAMAFFGALLAGGTPSPLVPPFVFNEADTYVQNTAQLLATAGDVVVTDNALLSVVARAQRTAGISGEPVVVGQIDRGAASSQQRPHSDLALLQFTSGSSGRPRGVRVTWENLEANIEMIRSWIDWGPDDAGAHWLPLYHDMGLIGCFLTPVINQRNLWIMRPDQFIREPLRWVERFGRGEAVFTAGPNFCFAYAAKHIKPEQLDGLDFSGWRSAIVGAERLNPGALARFASLLEPYGFRRETFLPAYGLAEATLAVSIHPPSDVPKVVRPDWSAIRFGAPVSIEEHALLGEGGVGDGAGWLVGCGRALEDLTVSVCDEDGCPLGDGILGELVVQGTTVASGYEGDADMGSTRIADGVLRTGDAGFTIDGEVFVVGRIGDALKVRGVTLYAEDLESKLCAIDGVPNGRCVVVPGLAHGVDSIAVVVEAAPGEWIERAMRVLERETNGARVSILTGPPGTIERTSSGKPRRRVIWRALIDGDLVVESVADSARVDLEV